MTTFPLGTYPVGRVGFGAMQLPGPGVFGPPRDHDQALAVLRRAVELGINHIDTAQFYGPNVANELIREALHPYPDESRAGQQGRRQARRPRQLAGGPGPRRTARRASRTTSAHCGTDRLAAVNLRVFGGDDPSAPAEVDRELFDRQLTTMIKARDEGLIEGIGLSSITADHLRIALDRTEIVCVQNAYNLVDRTSQPVLDLCIERSIAFVPFFPLGSAFARTIPCSATRRCARGGRRARPHARSDRAGVDAVGGAQCAADPRHLVGGAPGGEPRRRRHRTRRRHQTGTGRRGLDSPVRPDRREAGTGSKDVDVQPDQAN